MVSSPALVDPVEPSSETLVDVDVEPVLEDESATSPRSVPPSAHADANTACVPPRVSAHVHHQFRERMIAPLRGRRPCMHWIG
jgi:hypothetical protein